MVRTYLKTFGRMFRRHFTRLISIILMVLVSVGFTAGIGMSTDKINDSLAEYRDAQNVSDLILLNDDGTFTDDDVTALQKQFGEQNVQTGGMLEFEVKDGKATVNDTELTFTNVPDGIVRVYLFDEASAPSGVTQNLFEDVVTYDTSAADDDAIVVYAERATEQLEGYDEAQTFTLSFSMHDSSTRTESIPFLGEQEIAIETDISVTQNYVLGGTVRNPLHMAVRDDVKKVLEQAAGLGPGAVEQSLARHAAALEGGQTVEGVPADGSALGVDGGVEDHENPVFLVVLHKAGPDDGGGHGQTRTGGGEPAQVDAAHIGHENKRDDIGQGHAGVTGSRQNQRHIDAQNGNHLSHGPEGGNLVPVDAHGFGQYNNKGNLTDFAGLNAERQPGKGQPAAVAGAAVGAPDKQGAEKQHIENHKDFPSFGQNINIDKGKDHIETDADNHGKGLHQHETGGAHIGGGAGHDDDAEDTGRQTQAQQEQIGLSEKFPGEGQELVQLGALLLSVGCYLNIISV